MICQTDNAAGEVYPILPRCRKSHVKQQIQYELTCFSPFLATRCLHVANDFRVYSQLSLPICQLSAYTLCVRRYKSHAHVILMSKVFQNLLQVQAKMLRPSPTDDVFIPSNAFSGWMSGWTEGALEKVDEVLKYIQSDAD